MRNFSDILYSCLRILEPNTAPVRMDNDRVELSENVEGSNLLDPGTRATIKGAGIVDSADVKWTPV